MRFLKINILQGRVVTLFRCGDVYNNLFIADFLLSVTVKEFFFKWSYFVEIIHQSIQLTFLSHPVGAIRFEDLIIYLYWAIASELHR